MSKRIQMSSWSTNKINIFGVKTFDPWVSWQPIHVRVVYEIIEIIKCVINIIKKLY